MPIAATNLSLQVPKLFIRIIRKYIIHSEADKMDQN